MIEAPRDPDASPPPDDSSSEVQRVVVSRAGRGPNRPESYDASPDRPAGAPYIDLSAPVGAAFGSGKRAFVRTFRGVGLLAVIVAIAAGMWTGSGGRTGRGVLTTVLVLGPSLTIAGVLALRLAAWALAANARRQLGTPDPVGGDPVARAKARSAVSGAVLAMLVYAALMAWTVRAIWR